MTTRHEPDRLLMTCPWPVLAADDRAAYDDGPTSTSPFDAAVGRHVDALADLLGDRDAVAELSTAQLRDHVQVLRRLEGLTTASLAATVHLLHRRGGTREDGASSPTDWIRARTGRSGREAHRLARLGANLDDLPGTAAALSRGDVSAESADAIVQATGNGLLGDAREVEDQLLDDARTQSPEQLRASIRRREHQADGAALLRDERRQHANRRFAMQRQRDGMWRVNGHLQGELGARVRTALDAFDHADPRDDPPPRPRTPAQRLADALSTMVDVVVDHGMAPGTGGIAARTCRPSSTPTCCGPT